MAAKKPVVKKSKTKTKGGFNVDKKGIILIVAAVVFASVGAYFAFFSKAAAPLTWAPPSGYQNYPVKNVNPSSSLQSVSGNGGDMWVKLPSTPTGPISFTNCRNVVLIGGQIDLPKNSGSGDDQRGIYVNGCTGTVHIEGVYINGDIATAEGDGIAIKAPQAIVQVQNVRIYKLFGGYDTALHNHSDIIQPWGGVKELRVDYLTGSSNYQGFQINDDQGHIGKVVIKNTNIGDSGVTPYDKGGYFAWLKCGTGTSYSFTNFYIQPRSGRSLGNSIYDSSNACGLNASTASATFSNSLVSGTILSGKPAAGDFVPAGAAGIGYKSPGYADGTTPPPTTTTPPPTTTTPPPTTTTPPPTTTTPPPTTGTTEVISSGYNSNATSMQPVLSSWAIVGGRYANTVVKSNLTANSNIAVNPLVVAGDFTLSANAKVNSTSGVWDDFSLIFDYKDVNNYYYASFNESNDAGTSGIFKVQNGTVTQLKDITSAIKAGVDYRVTVVRKGTAISVKLNDTLVATVNDGTFVSGKVGYGSRNNAVSFDNLLVTQ